MGKKIVWIIKDYIFGSVALFLIHLVSKSPTVILSSGKFLPPKLKLDDTDLF